MPVTLTYYTVKERTPKANADIIWLEPISSFDLEGLMPREISVEYEWVLLDKDGNDVGDSEVYDATDKQPQNSKLRILFNGYEALDTFLWCPVDEYWKSFENVIITGGSNGKAE